MPILLGFEALWGWRVTRRRDSETSRQRTIAVVVVVVGLVLLFGFLATVILSLILGIG